MKDNLLNQDIIVNLRLSTLTLIVLFLAACSKPEDYAGQPKNRLDRLSKVERAELAPNELFMAVFNGDVQRADQVSSSNPSLMLSRNIRNGNTPLGEAIELAEIEIAKMLYSRMPLEVFFEGNQRGESVIFQASRAGWVWLIEALADQYYKSLGGVEDYEFSDLDFENHEGQKALHVARTAHVAEVLKTEYYRGFLEIPFQGFTFHRDSSNKNFLHTAAQDARYDVLRWGVRHFCGHNSWEKEGGWLTGTLGYLAERTQRGVQTYVGGLGLDLDIKFNQQDLLGNTPLHYVSQNRDLEGLQIVLSCEWVDFDLEDVEGNIPLQTFLLSLPDNQVSLPSADFQFLSYLLEQRTRMRSWFRSKTDYVNHQNKQGDTALHLAARLADPRFYQALSRFGDIEKPNHQGLSSREIFNSRNTRVQNYDR